MDRFWRLLERHRWPAMPVHEWRGEIGVDALAQLRRAGFFESHPLDEEDWFPCPGGGLDGCPRRVVRLGGQLVAVCRNAPVQCDDVAIAEEDAEVLAVTEHSLRAALAGPARLEAGTGEPLRRGRLRLGVRRFGTDEVAVWYAQRLMGEEAADWVGSLVRREPAVAAIGLLVPRESAVEPRIRGELRGRGVTVLPMDRLVRFGGAGLTVDLADLVLEHRFAGIDLGAELWPRYELALHPAAGDYWWRGQRSPTLRRWRIPASMLVALAERAGEMVSRHELAGIMWPDDYGARGSVERDWDRMIRQQKRALERALAEDCGEPIPRIEAVVGGSDLDGGYRLVLEGRSILSLGGTEPVSSI